MGTVTATRDELSSMSELPPYPGAPRWVKVSGIILGILVLLAAILVFTGVGGPHGPGRHMLDDDAGDQPQTSQPAGGARQ